ncbi:hypothetical protein C8R43DRAFT_1130196 [Mycena crocata]|nr:hypothetical protein C8R43DRAFT_1130196 [Mycena crocata]
MPSTMHSPITTAHFGSSGAQVFWCSFGTPAHCFPRLNWARRGSHAHDHFAPLLAAASEAGDITSQSFSSIITTSFNFKSEDLKNAPSILYVNWLVANSTGYYGRTLKGSPLNLSHSNGETSYAVLAATSNARIIFKFYNRPNDFTGHAFKFETIFRFSGFMIDPTLPHEDPTFLQAIHGAFCPTASNSVVTIVYIVRFLLRLKNPRQRLANAETMPGQSEVEVNYAPRLIMVDRLIATPEISSTSKLCQSNARIASRQLRGFPVQGRNYDPIASVHTYFDTCTLLKHPTHVTAERFPLNHNGSLGVFTIATQTRDMIFGSGIRVVLHVREPRFPETTSNADSLPGGVVNLFRFKSSTKTLVPSQVPHPILLSVKRHALKTLAPGTPLSHIHVNSHSQGPKSATERVFTIEYHSRSVSGSAKQVFASQTSTFPLAPMLRRSVGTLRVDESKIRFFRFLLISHRESYLSVLRNQARESASLERSEIPLNVRVPVSGLSRYRFTIQTPLYPTWLSRFPSFSATSSTSNPIITAKNDPETRAHRCDTRPTRFDDSSKFSSNTHSSVRTAYVTVLTRFQNALWYDFAEISCADIIPNLSSRGRTAQAERPRSSKPRCTPPPRNFHTFAGTVSPEVADSQEHAASVRLHTVVFTRSLKAVDAKRARKGGGGAGGMNQSGSEWWYFLKTHRERKRKIPSGEKIPPECAPEYLDVPAYIAECDGLRRAGTNLAQSAQVLSLSAATWRGVPGPSKRGVRRAGMSRWMERAGRSSGVLETEQGTRTGW